MPSGDDDEDDYTSDDFSEEPASAPEPTAEPKEKE